MYEEFDPRTKEHKRQDRQDASERETRREKMLRSGMTVDQVLSAEGVTGQKEGGGMPWKNLYGPGGLYSVYGGAVLPGWEYDWVNGMKFPTATSDPNRKWEQITDHERRGRSEYENFLGQNPTANSYADYLNWQGNQQARRYGHAQAGPGGFSYNVGTGNPSDPSTYSEWWNPLGQKVSGMGYKGSNTRFPGQAPAMTPGYQGPLLSNPVPNPNYKKPGSPLVNPGASGQNVGSNPQGAVRYNPNQQQPMPFGPNQNQKPVGSRYVPGIGGF